MTESIKREFIENAAEIGIDLNDKMLSSFDIYYKNLLEWNAVMNLTAITEEKDVYLWIWEPEPAFRDSPSP